MVITGSIMNAKIVRGGKKVKRKPKLIYVRQLCRNCKNQRMFHVKKKLFINHYCLQCIICKTKIQYPKRFGTWQEYYLKNKWRKEHGKDSRT